MKKQNFSSFKLIFSYLKEDKFKLALYIILIIATYMPGLLATFFFGIALEALVTGDFSTFIYSIILYESIWILSASVLTVPRDLIYNSLEIKFSKNVLKEIYKKISNMPAIAFERIGVGEFINRMITDPNRVMDLLARLIKLICKSVVIIVVIFIAFSNSILLGIEILIFAFIMGFISTRFFPKIKKTQEEIKKESDLQVKTATENLTGIREIKALGIKENIEKKMNFRIDSLFNNQKKIRKYEVMYFNINSFVYFILQLVILLTSGYLVVNGEMSYASFIIIESYIWRIDEVVQSISDFGINYNTVIVSLKRIDEVVNNKLYNDEKFGNKTIENATGRIEFNNVRFKYNEDEDHTLRGLNLVIEPNKKTAIIGRSGNGKSTIFNLLLRYFDVTKGNIKIDGINIEDLTEDSLRQNVSIISQNPFLFNLSILDNFKLVKENVTLEEVREVCKRAYIDEYIMSLPKQYETIIGEGGINLSGGQKQRIAIARTLLINTKIILFDEATSALDNESQEYIKQTIDNLMIDHTVIVVAHRLSTIIDADIIHIIEKGKVEASGEHRELLKTNKTYQNLYNMETSNSI